LVIRICLGFRASYFGFALLPRPSSLVPRPSSVLLYPLPRGYSSKHPPQVDSSTPKVKKCKKSVQKRLISCNFCSKPVHFCKKNAKKCKKTLIFTLIFRPKTNKSYKSPPLAIAIHPNFQNFRQKPYFLDFLSFFLLFFIFILSILAAA